MEQQPIPGWDLGVWRPPDGFLHGSFVRTSDAWAAFNAAVLELEVEGFVSGEHTSVEYGGRCVEEFSREDGETAVVRLERSTMPSQCA